jgi:hypothetical protein
MAGQRYDKLLSGICNSPTNVRLADACKAAAKLGFVERQRGSHHAFSRTGEPIGLNFQKTSNGMAKPYQVRQLITMIEKYWDWEKNRVRTEGEVEKDD